MGVRAVWTGQSQLACSFTPIVDSAPLLRDIAAQEVSLRMP